MIEVGRGGNITISITINDEESLISPEDTWLFVIKRTADTAEYMLSKKVKFAEMSYNEESKAYLLLIELTSEETMQFNLGTYFYDFTYVNANGQKFPQMKPAEFNVVSTIGASSRRGEKNEV